MISIGSTAPSETMSRAPAEADFAVLVVASVIPFVPFIRAQGKDRVRVLLRRC